MEGEVAEIVQAQKEVVSLMLAFVESMALKCILELRILDIIHSHGSPMSLPQIVKMIGSPSLNIPYLSRLMSLLVHKKIFSTAFCEQSGETLYGLTLSSRLLLRDSDMTMAPLFLMNTHPWLVEPWHQLGAAVKDGGTVFQKAYGSSLWAFASKNPELNNLFNNGIQTWGKFTVEAILMTYKDGFGGIDTLVDVAGGNGYLVSEIVKANSPLIRGINFDLQHVVESAPTYPGITHVGGDMFEFIPNADAIIIKSVLHNWSDEDCKRILRNCRRALSKTTMGKLILVEMVVEPEGGGLFDDAAVKFELLMMANFLGGKERTQTEWISLLQDAGFIECKFIKIPALQCIIEAYASATQ